MIWLLDHWWVANAVPYVAFNAWLLYTFEREEGAFSSNARFWFAVAGLWIVLLMIAWISVEQIGARLRQMNRAARIVNRPLYWVWLVRALLAAGSLTFVLLVTGALNALVLALFSNLRPSRGIILVADAIVMIFIGGFVVMYYSFKKESRRGK